MRSRPVAATARALLRAILFSSLYVDVTEAAKLVEGSFLAVEDCPVYVSKIARTNPDEMHLEPGRIYSLFEVNYAEKPDAYRIRVEEAHPKERWISATCGEYPPHSSPADIIARHRSVTNPPSGPAPVMEWHCPSPPLHADQCRTCEKPDSWILTLHWYTGQCESSKKRLADTQCQSGLTTTEKQFSLREWKPIKKTCKKEWKNCDSTAQKGNSPSDYPPLSLKETTRQRIMRIMPGSMSDSGLERPVWYQYGMCSGLSEEAYFTQAASLVEQFNQSGMARFLYENKGKLLRREEFFKQIDHLLGSGARTHINIECSADTKWLTGVVIHLPSEATNTTMGLNALLQRAPRAGARGNCASRFMTEP